MANYSIIKDEKLFREFIQWLPELDETERYYVCLFARTKYCKDIVHVKSDKQQLKRFLTKKEDMYEKIKQLEVEFGAYTQKNVAMPQEALALYITPNPRNMWKATHNALVKLAQCIRDDNYQINPVQEVMSEVHKAKSRTCWIDFDFDIIREEQGAAIEEVNNHINPEAVVWLQSRGGLHCLIDPSKVSEEYKRSFWKNISNMKGVDQSGDNMIPVVGCTQGNFTPYFLKHEYEHVTEVK